MFSKATQTWFEQSFDAPTEIQRRGWPVIARRKHALLVAPTGSGKTLAAFLAGIDSVAGLPADASPGVRVLYVSPLKALVYDVERNLRAPLVGIRRVAEQLGARMREVRVDVRTGDTPARERRLQARSPADILVTTPESLFLILGSKAAATLSEVHTVIVDEVHALAPVKRGTHLSLSLERLAETAARDPLRIGLSATARPLDEVARFLGGDRPVEIVDASSPPRLDLSVVVPVPDMENVGSPPPAEEPGGPVLGTLYRSNAGAPSVERGIWPAIYPELLERVRRNRASIVFVNSRGLCERLSQRLNELADEPLVRAHHGSLSHRRRREIEEGLKDGSLRGIVATSSLELGIDMGAVDLVMLVESPGSVARGLQRVGRAGHRVGATSKGRIFPKFRGDLLECAVVSTRMRQGLIEALRVPRNVLDVLAQQVVALCCDRPRTVEQIGRVVRRAAPFRDLSQGALEAVLDMLSGRFPSTDFADLRPLLSWDRSNDRLSARRGAAVVSRMNAGTIPDRGQYGVFLGEGGPRVGELDEEMVHETRVGDNILLGASTWRVEEITRDRIRVSPAPGEPGRLPFWKGEGPGRPIELGRAIGRFVGELGAKKDGKAVEWLMRETSLDRFAAENLASYLAEQRRHTGSLPTDRAITVERFRDELGDWRVCILSPFGSRIHAPWALALQRRIAAGGVEVQVMYTDDGLVLRLADTDELPELAALFPDPEEVEDLVTDQLAQSPLFASLFRENAVRSLLLPRRRPGRRTPLWAQRLKSQQLLGTVRRFPGFPIVLETYRQVLSDVFDMPGLRDLLAEIRSRSVRIDEVETRSASPFARSLVFAYVAAYMYEGDSPAAERRAQALTLDRGLLAELLGQAELRELIDPRVLEELELELQHLSEHRRARDADEIHDLLRHLGDLTREEIAARSDHDPDAGLERLDHERRATEIRLAGERRWIATDDAGLYRDALGAMPPPGLPDSLLAPVDSPLEKLIARWARHHGPFLAKEAAARFALLPAQVEPVLRALEAEGVLVRGEIRPGGVRLEWCDAEVLRRLKRRTLAKLRREVAPVAAGVLGRFLPFWHGIGRPAVPSSGTTPLLEAIHRLQGLAVSWRTLSQVLLPERVPGFTLEMLDAVAASGEVVWVGRGALGVRDGRVAVYLREQASRLIEPDAEPAADSPVHDAILQHLAARGASFLPDLRGAVGRSAGDPPSEEFRAALWDLVWAGRITNDTFAPLKSLGRSPSRATRGRPRGDPWLASGRWSLVDDLRRPEIGDTERAVAWAEVLLERYGVVSREAALAEELPGGFAAVYQVLKTAEEGGRVRRGFFVEGLSGAQFALAGSVDRLRGLRVEEHRDEPTEERDVSTLAAVDPANPYGTLLPWPEGGDPERRPRRIPGAAVVLVRGLPALWIGPRARHVITFPETLRAEPDALVHSVRALRRLPRGLRHRSLIVEKIDGVPVADSPHFAALRDNGFAPDYRGLIAEPGF